VLKKSCETNGAMMTQHINADLSAAASKGGISAKDKAIHYRGWPVVFFYLVPEPAGPSIPEGRRP
jgi:hypothetical protein